MPIYVTLVQFTDQGLRNIKESPHRLEVSIKAAASAGVKYLGVYYTPGGAYDMMAIVEAEDERMAVALGLASLAQGNVRATTMRAFTPAEFAGIVQKMP